MSKFYDKSAASFRATTIDSKVIDAQKILINTDPSQIDERQNLIDYVDTINNDITAVIKGGFKSVDDYSTNEMNGILDNATVTGVQFSNNHFVKGGSKIESITLPYNNLSNVTSVGYLSVQVSVVEGVFEDKIYYSTNTVNYGDATKTEAKFDFTDFVLPEDYLYVRLCLVSTRTTIPNNATNTNCLNFRVRPIKINDSFTFDDDGCCAYANTEIKVWLIAATVKHSEPVAGIETTVNESADSIKILEERTQYIVEEEISSIEEMPSTSGDCDAFNIHSAKVPSAPIKSIEIPVNNTVTTQTFVVAYDVDSATSTKKLLGRSRNFNTWVPGDRVKWTFENPLQVEDGHNLEIFLAKDSSTITDTTVAPVGYYIKLYSNGTGNDRIRYGNSWNYTREVYLIFYTEENQNLGEAITNSESILDALSQTLSDNILSNEEKFSEIDDSLERIENKNYAFTDSSNTFLSSNTFESTLTLNADVLTGPNSSVSINDNFKVLPLGVKTAKGEDAYGLSVSSSGGIQIWGTHFTQRDEWSNNALKIHHRNLALLGDHNEPTTLTFDNANLVEFKVMPDDGSAANNGQGAIFDFQGWQWDDNTLTTKNSNCPVQILKNNAGSLTERSILNKAELDENYIIANDDNKHIVDTLNETIEAAGIHATGWFIPGMLTDGVILIDGVEYGSSSGSSYEEAFANYINSVETAPVTATVDGTRVVLIAKKQGTEGTKITIDHKAAPNPDDDSFRSGETLTIDDNNYVENVETIKKIDFLSDSDIRFAQRNTDNEFSGNNTFNQTIVAKENIFVSNGVITFEDLIEGTVVERSGASGYQYVEGMPTSFNNGVCYDIGEISSTTDLSNVKFSSEKLVQTCELWFRTPATVPTGYKWPTDLYWIDSATGAAPTLIASKNYRLVFRREPNKIIASIAYLY